MQKQFFIGIDVHKKSTTYAIRDWNGKLVSEAKCATTFRDVWSGIEPYALDCKVAIEACTSYYHLYKGFKEKGIDIRVANVIQIRTLIGKNDKLDAIRLADMLRLNTLPESFIPDDTIQHMRSLVKLRYNFIIEKTRLKNEIHAVLDKEGTSFPVRTAFCKKWCDYLQKYITQTNCFELRFLFEAEQQAKERIKVIDLEIECFVKEHFEKTSELLKSIPGVGNVWSAYLISQILPINRFADKKKLKRYAGVIPVFDSSENKVYGTYLPKGSSRKLLRYALVEIAHSAVKTKGNIREYFEKKKKEKKKCPIMYVASSMSDIIFNVLTTGKPYTG